MPESPTTKEEADDAERENQEVEARPKNTAGDECGGDDGCDDAADAI